MSTEPTTPAVDTDEDIIEAVIFVRLRRMGRGFERIETADREAALARLASMGVPVPVHSRYAEDFTETPVELWVIDPEGVDVRMDAEQVEAARWAVTPQ